MRQVEYSELDGIGLAELIRVGDVSLDEVFEVAKTAIEAVDSKLDFLVADTYEFAAAGIKEGLPSGPFTGVPFLKKDLGQGCKGILNDWGCEFARDTPTERDSNLYRRIKDAGLLIVGRSATPPFGSSATTEPTYRAPTRNPWHTEHSPGGSSGGAAAAVAAGAVPIAHASDAGGSIRMPAAYCNLVGHKPSRGLLPSGPDLGELVGGIATDGVVTRTVRDTAAFLDAVAGPDIGCKYFTAPPSRPFLQTLDELPGRLRIAFNPQPLVGYTTDPALFNAVERAAAILEAEGHIVEHVDPEPDALAETAGAAAAGLFGVFIAHVINTMKEASGREPTPENLGPVVYRAYEFGSKALAVDYERALGALNQFTRAFGQFFQEYDLLLEPTTFVPPPKLGVIPDSDFNVTAEEYWRISGPVGAIATRANQAGLPAISVPWGLNTSGLPMGVQFTAATGADALCLQVARYFEQVRPWAQLRPPVHVSTFGDRV